LEKGASNKMLGNPELKHCANVVRQSRIYPVTSQSKLLVLFQVETQGNRGALWVYDYRHHI